jgi:hypothetical protein
MNGEYKMKRLLKLLALVIVLVNPIMPKVDACSIYVPEVVYPPQNYSDYRGKESEARVIPTNGIFLINTPRNDVAYYLETKGTKNINLEKIDSVSAHPFFEAYLDGQSYFDAGQLSEDTEYELYSMDDENYDERDVQLTFITTDNLDREGPNFSNEIELMIQFAEDDAIASVFDNSCGPREIPAVELSNEYLEQLEEYHFGTLDGVLDYLPAHYDLSVSLQGIRDESGRVHAHLYRITDEGRTYLKSQSSKTEELELTWRIEEANLSETQHNYALLIEDVFGQEADQEILLELTLDRENSSSNVRTITNIIIDEGPPDGPEGPAASSGCTLIR